VKIQDYLELHEYGLRQQSTALRIQRRLTTSDAAFFRRSM
jgi:hypothetical protein